MERLKDVERLYSSNADIPTIYKELKSHKIPELAHFIIKSDPIILRTCRPIDKPICICNALVFILFM